LDKGGGGSKNFFDGREGERAGVISERRKVIRNKALFLHRVGRKEKVNPLFFCWEKTRAREE